jgi:predicted nucleotidyltransferase
MVLNDMAHDRNVNATTPALLEELRSRREDILRAATARGARSIRVFGSVARGDATPDSDIDLLVELEPGRSLVDLSGLQLDLAELLGRKVHVVQIPSVVPGAAAKAAERIRGEAVTL